MEMEKPEAQAEREGDGRVEGKFAQTDGEVFETQAQVETGSVELADEDEAVDACVQKKHLVEDGQVRRPGALEPAQIDGEAKNEKDEEVAPVASLGRVGTAGVPKQHGDQYRKQSIKQKPPPAKHFAGESNQYVGGAQEGRRGQAKAEGQRLHAGGETG